MALTGCTGTTCNLGKGTAASQSFITCFAAATRGHRQDLAPAVQSGTQDEKNLQDLAVLSETRAKQL